MKELLIIGSGGFIGAISRYLLSSYLNFKLDGTKFPWGTFLVNSIGCLLIGLILGITTRKTFNPHINSFFVIGLIGAFTTFSTFSHEFFSLLTQGKIWLAFFYTTISIISGLFFVYLGDITIKTII